LNAFVESSAANEKMDAPEAIAPVPVCLPSAAEVPKLTDLKLGSVASMVNAESSRALFILTFAPDSPDELVNMLTVTSFEEPHPKAIPVP
jgi:hypothetical protein